MSLSNQKKIALTNHVWLSAQRTRQRKLLVQKFSKKINGLTIHLPEINQLFPRSALRHETDYILDKRNISERRLMHFKSREHIINIDLQDITVSSALSKTLLREKKGEKKKKRNEKKRKEEKT